MPEGDTVYRQAAALSTALAGELLLSSDFRVPDYATLDLSGEPVESVVARGKHLLMRVGKLSIQSHLRMEGSWHVYTRAAQDGEPAGRFPRWRRPAHTARCILTTQDHQAVGFSLGELRVLPREEEAAALNYLGPDPLGPDWDVDEARRRLLHDQQRSIGVALLDQRNLAGIGNVLRSEICFLARVHPAVPVGELDGRPEPQTAGTPEAAQAGTPDGPPSGQSDVALNRVLDLSQRLLSVNSLRTRRRTTGTAGSTPDYWVYGRRGQACLRCRTRIVRAELGEQELRRRAVQDRVIYFCPSCQPAPRP